MSISTHACSLCDYTTIRKFNLERHLSLVHNCHSTPDAEKVALNTTFVAANTTFVAANTTLITPENISIQEVIENDVVKYKCSGCNKLYTRKYRCIKHLETCKKVSHANECDVCHLACASKYALSRHKKTCTKKEETLRDILTIEKDKNVVLHGQNTLNHNTVTGGTNNTAIGTQHNTINVIAFPNGMQDETFKFVKDHITPAVLASIMKKQPEQAFANYVGTLLEKEENRMIKKHSPNVNYCTIHKGDNQWDLVLDHDAIPVLTHHVTRSSFEDILKNKKKLAELQIDLDKLRKYIDDINTENDENDNYNLSLQRTKLMLVNFTRKWGKDESDL